MASTSVTVAVWAFGQSFSNVVADSERLVVKNACSENIWIATDTSKMPNTPGVKLLTPGQETRYNIPDYFLPGTRFWPKMGCNADGQECEIGDSGGPGQTCHNGCAPPVDSKFEATWNSNGVDWWDTSAVDGFTLPYKVEVSGSCSQPTIDCSHLTWDSCPHENIAGVGDTDLTLRSPFDNKVVGCYNPCTILTHDNWNNPLGHHSPEDGLANPYCCPTPPVSSQQCKAGPAASSEFTKLIHAHCPHVYAYAYDDDVGLSTCPQNTVYTWTLFCPGGSPTPTPSPSPSPTPPSSGVSICSMVRGDLCLDLTDGAEQDGTKLQVWTADPSNPNSNQRWQRRGTEILHHTADGRDLCIDIPNNDHSNGNNLQVWTCAGSPQQQWEQDGNAFRVSNSCMDLTDGITTDGNKIQIWECNGGVNQNQQWQLRNLGDESALMV